MNVTSFVGEYDVVASVLQLSSGELRSRDEARGGVRRWVAWQDGRCAGVADASERPDGRMFLRCSGGHETVGDLAAASAAELNRPLYVTVDEADSGMFEALSGGGFETEVVSESFTVPFAAALRSVRRAWVPSGYGLIDARNADSHRLFRLDNAVRNLVPGSDGWKGNWGWFQSELDDPAAYVVGVFADDYVGLARIWRNPSGPRFGLIGVLPEHRRTPLAAALLKTVLTEAAAWGYQTFTTETSLSNATVYPRLARLGTPTGRFLQMVRRADIDAA